MTDLLWNGVKGWKTQVDPAGNLKHEEMGVGELSFSSDHLQFKNLKIPYQKAEAPKLHTDRLFLRNLIRFDIVYLDAQYTFTFRAKLKQFQEIPLPFQISIDRYIWMNIFYGYLAIQIFLFLCMMIYKWLLK